MKFFLLTSNPWLIGGLILIAVIVAAMRRSAIAEARSRENIRRQRPSPTYQVRRGGEVISGLTVQRISQMKAAGQIHDSDEYLDPLSGQWVALDLLPRW